tara:strand:- start:48796 stop:49260 length:465 start_codon:yes stop_codon:yes gene_type:complete
MSKRRREGPTLVTNKRFCDQPIVTTGFKRRRDEHCDYSDKRYRVSTPDFSGNKRSADFDQEVEHMHKRMRATVPTAEETMAFILPYLLTMRRMYTKAQNDADSMINHCDTLEKHLTTMQTAYHKLIGQNNVLKRELNMAKYRLMLKDRENPNYT